MVKIFLVLLFLQSVVFANSTDTIAIKKHLVKITKTEKTRNFKNIETLNIIAEYIYGQFSIYADTTYYQKYDVNGIEYKNVICVFGSHNAKTIVVGAHYDVCGGQEGADDNASGVVGLLELAKMFQDKKLNYRIEMVAYTLEEPPFFRSEYMGSYVHAKYLKDKMVNVFGMVSLEMIGYFNESKNTQDYPIGLLSVFYGSRGNYITLVNKFGKGKFSKKFTHSFKKVSIVRTKKFTSPKSLAGIDFSDHLNYWAFGFSSLMITDTAFFRNKNYHEKTDKIETLNLSKMAEVIDAIFESLLNLK